jgi:hypothetical protein
MGAVDICVAFTVKSVREARWGATRVADAEAGGSRIHSGAIPRTAPSEALAVFMVNSICEAWWGATRVADAEAGGSRIHSGAIPGTAPLEALAVG